MSQEQVKAAMVAMGVVTALLMALVGLWVIAYCAGMATILVALNPTSREVQGAEDRAQPNAPETSTAWGLIRHHWLGLALRVGLLVVAALQSGPVLALLLLAAMVLLQFGYFQRTGHPPTARQESVRDRNGMATEA